MQLIPILLGLAVAACVSGQDDDFVWVANITNVREMAEVGRQQRISEDWAYCFCYMDPHCRSFDYHWNHFQGKCLYTMARDNCENGIPDGRIPTWEVIIDNEDATDGRHGDFVSGDSWFSAVHNVKIKLHDRNMVIHLKQWESDGTGGVVVNGNPVLGGQFVPTQGVHITKSSHSVTVIVTDGIKAIWSPNIGSMKIQVEIPGFMRGHVCGICGNANSDWYDDWVVGDSNQCMDRYPDANPGDILSSFTQFDEILFGTSWMADADEDDPECVQDCPNHHDYTCPEIYTKKAEKHCHILQDMQGPFMDCLAQMSNDQREMVFGDCVFDSCGLREFKTIVCGHAAALADYCQDQIGVNVCWRTPNFCPMECGEGMEYKTCGNPCLPTCSDPIGENCGPINRCEEGCFCKEDLVSDGEGKCIPQNQCGCLVPEYNVMIPVKTQFLRDNCEEICRCHGPQEDLECEPYECDRNEVCGLTKTGIRACLCPKPYARDSKDGQCKDVCDLSKAVGIGSRSVIRWYYNKKKGKCMEFIYKGQGGNENNFNSERDCKVVCIGPEEAEHCEQCCPGAEFLSCDVPEEDQCMDHADCDLGSICCPARCGRVDVCVTPVECCCPELPFGPENASTACRDDRDCEHRDEICCWGGRDFNYEMQCVAPIPCPCYPTQHDLCCPKSHRNQAKRDPTCQYCTSDIQCEPSMVCCVGADGCSYCVQGSINTCDSMADIEE